MDEIIATKKTIDKLPASTDVGDTDSILIIGNDGLAYKVEVSELKDFLAPKASIKIVYDEETYPDGLTNVLVGLELPNDDHEEIFEGTITKSGFVIDNLKRGTYEVDYADTEDNMQSVTVTINEIKEYKVIIE